MKRIFIALACLSVAMTGCSQTGKQNAAQQKAAAAKEQSAGKAAGADADNDASGKVHSLTAADFKRLVMDYEKHPQEWVFEGKRPAVVDFYATWCGPCKMMSPVVEEFAKEYKGKVDFYKIDVDKEKELASVFGIQSIPMFLFIPTKGKPTVQMGAMEKAEFGELVKSVLTE